MKRKQISVTIEGISPLLMNKFTDEAMAKADGGNSLAIVGDRGTPREQAAPKVYTDSMGHPVIPGPNIFACIMQAGIYRKAGKKQITTGRSSLIPAGMNVNDVECPVLDPQLGPAKWEVDTRAIVNPSTKGRRGCHRPRFDQWRLSFSLDVDVDMFDPKLVRQLIDDAGSRVGLGDFRPDRKGPFGRFKVIAWDVSEISELAA